MSAYKQENPMDLISKSITGNTIGFILLPDYYMIHVFLQVQRRKHSVEKAGPYMSNCTDLTKVNKID